MSERVLNGSSRPNSPTYSPERTHDSTPVTIDPVLTPSGLSSKAIIPFFYVRGLTNRRNNSLTYVWDQLPASRYASLVDTPRGSGTSVPRCGTLRCLLRPSTLPVVTRTKSRVTVPPPRLQFGFFERRPSFFYVCWSSNHDPPS